MEILFENAFHYCLMTIAFLPAFLAEREGFEPPVPEGTTVFETAPFDRSGTSPTLKVNSKFKKQNSKKRV